MYKVNISLSALNDLDSIDGVIRERIVTKLHWVGVNFEGIKIVPLKAELAGRFKLKVGDYRVIYEVNWEKKEINILKIGHRKDIYKTDLN